MIVNSLAGEALRRSWLCLAPFGRFIEVGKMDLMRNSGLEMRPFLTGKTFSGCNLEYMMTSDPPRVSALVSNVLRLFDNGDVKLVQPIRARDFSNVEDAFRELQRGTHIGKLVLRITGESRVPVVPPKVVNVRLKTDATYLLVGGLGGLGRAQAMFLAENGARYMAFISRSGCRGAEAEAAVAVLVEQGVEVKTYAGDVARREDLESILADMAQNMPPIRGVIHGAMQLDDSVFHKMSYQQWLAATRPKVQGELTCILDPDTTNP